MAKETYNLEDLRRWKEVTASEKVPLRLAVIGDPVAHSLSPQMHNAALEAMGEQVRYARLHLKPEELEEGLGLLPRAGFIGINVTIPHKAAVLELVDHVDDHARLMGAVNTVLVEGDTLHGFSTDGPGFVRAIREEFSVDVRDLRVMVLGAGGGAGRSIAMQCALEHCERLVLVNRTVERAESLAKELAPYMRTSQLLGPKDRLAVLSTDPVALEEELQDIDLIVNATSIGMARTDPSPLPQRALMPFHMVYDTVYAHGDTRLVLAARAVGARAANGLSMLLHQGVLSLEIWLQKSPPVSVMRAALGA